jgi:hypothetical protein
MPPQIRPSDLNGLAAVDASLNFQQFIYRAADGRKGSANKAIGIGLARSSRICGACLMSVAGARGGRH